MGKKPIVKLRVYRGREMNFNEDGSSKNENQLISVEYKSMQWKLTMKNLPIMGYCKVIVDHVLEDKGGLWVKTTESIKSYSKEVLEAYSPKSKAPKTADQLRIEQLEAKLEAFISKKDVEEDVEEDVEDGLKKLQLEYFTLMGKKPHHMKKAEGLIEEMDNFKNK